jgi:predicted permease
MIRHPLMSGLTLATLVIGVASTAIVFSVVHAVVLAPLPVDEPDQLVHVSQTSPQGRRYSTSEPNFVDFRARSRSFTEMAAMGWNTPILSGVGDPESVDGRMVSHTFFGLLGIAPVLGRDFLPDEDVFGGATDVVLLAEGAWQRRFGGDPDIVGGTITLDGVNRRVVGVVPSDRAWTGVEVFTPLAPNPDVYRDDQRLETIARLATGVTLEDARRDMSDLAAQLSVEYPESNDRWGAAVRPIRAWLVGEQLTRLGTLLLGSVVLFLLMACASVSNLLLARASVRVREMGVRAALGAGRARIASQLATEAAVLAMVGGGLAVVLAFEGLRVVQAVGPGDIARLGQASVDGTVLLVSAGAAMATVMVAGIAPALLLMRDEVFRFLRAGARVGSGLGSGLRSSLVVVQFALAVTVVSGAALLTRSFVELQAVDMGFDAGGMVRFAVRLPDEQFTQVAREDFLRLLKEGVEAIPGVESMGATTAAPFAQMRPSNFVARSDQEPDRQEDFQPVSWRAVTGDFFEAAGIPLLSGRAFGPQDRTDRAGEVQNPPVIIDRTLADLLFPGEDPVGRLVTWFLPGGRQCEIVGVVESARDERIDAEARPRIYRPFTFTAWDQPTVLVRTAGAPEDVIPALRAATLAVDRSVPAISPTAVSEDVRATVAWPRFSMQVLTIFGMVALLLAAMGIYGVTSFSVSQKRHEIGVRMALGAEPTGVHWMVVRRALRLAAVGIGLGVVASLGLTRFLEHVLYDVSTTDPLTFLVVPVVMGLVAVMSTWIPARRAVSLDPREALVSE